MEAAVAAAEAATAAVRERCMMQPVQSVESRLRSPSSQMEQGPFTAVSAIRSISLQGHPEDTKPI